MYRSFFQAPIFLLVFNPHISSASSVFLFSDNYMPHTQIMLVIAAFIFLAIFPLLIYSWLQRKIKNAEERVRIETERYVMLFENTVVGLECYDARGVLVDRNRADCALFGMDDCILVDPVSLYDNPLLKENISSDNVQPYTAVLEYDLRKGHRHPYFDRSTRDEIILVQTRVCPIRNRNGELLSIIVTSIEVTQVESLRVNLEGTTEYLRLALKAGDLVAWTYDVHTQIFNKLMSKGGDLCRTYSENMERLHPDDQASVRHSFRKIITGQEDKIGLMYRYLEEDGQYHYYEGQIIGKKINGRVVSIAGTKKDITDRIEQRKLLENTLKKLRFAIRVSDVVFFEYSTQTRLFKAYNEPLNNFDEQKLLSLADYLPYTHPEDVKKVHLFFESLNSHTQELMSIDIRITLPGDDGQWRFSSLTIAPFEYDDDGQVINFVGFRRDNTQWVKGRKKLEEYKIKMELAIRSSRIQVWEYDCADGRFYTDSDGGLSVDEFSTLDDYIRYIHPEDRDRAQNYWEMVARGEDCSFNLEFRIKNEQMASWHYLMVGCVPFAYDDNGRCVKYAGYRLDSTHWHELNANLESSNQLLNTIVDSLPCALFIKDLNDNSRYIIVNRYMADTMHRTKEELIGRLAPEIYDNKEDIERFLESDRLAEELGSYTYRESIDFGTKQVFHNTKFVINTINGQRLLVGIALDITSLDQMMQELQLEKEKAQQADKLKSAFLANMSHEIRTPLNAIVGFSQMLQLSESADEHREYIHIINTNSDMLLRLVGDILDLSKIESGLIDLQPARVDMAEVFDETFLMLRQRCTNPNIDFIERNPYKSCKVTLDKNRFMQIGTNFLTNAIKYTEQGSIVMGYEYKDGGIRIYVEDTGIGIPEEKQSRVFHRFEKLDSFAQGTGLGLAICKAIIEVMGGKIGFTSKLGVGSTFWAWVPCEAEIIVENLPIKRHEQISDSAISETMHSAAGEDVSILVAEDNDSNYLLIKTMLKGYHLERTRDGVEAVELAAQKKYSVILMDMRMPNRDGLEATRMIRQFDPQIYIVAVTANAFESDRECAMRAGCNAFITKPIFMDELSKVFAERSRCVICGSK